jgi:hypothetical protein
MENTISSRTLECLEAFDRILSRPSHEPKELEIWDRERRRFVIWSANIGAHQKGPTSLDERLRDSSHIRDVAIGFLQNLLDTLSQGKEVVEFRVFQLLFEDVGGAAIFLCPVYRSSFSSLRVLLHSQSSSLRVH